MRLKDKAAAVLSSTHTNFATTFGGSSRSPVAAKDIADRFERQTLATSALSALDRAILSHANADRLVECVLRSAPLVVNCPFVSVTLIDHDLATRGKTFLVHAEKLQDTHSERCEISTERVQFLTTRPDGCALDDPRDYPFLSPLASRGAKSFFLWPVYWEGSVSAILTIGLTDRRALDPDERTHARHFADRLGVALWTSALAKKVKQNTQLDSATALLNRHTFKDRLAQEIARARREKHQIALMFIDLDQFRKVNDSIGHAGGDVLLEEASRRLKHCLREGDIVARFAGDEFAILLPSISKGVNAEVVAKKLITQLSRPFNIGGTEHNLSASIGICVCPDDGQSVDALFSSADVAMYRAKARGGGNYAFFEQRVQAKMLNRVSLETDLRDALSDESLKLFYQPQFDLVTGQIVGAEALMRWPHARRGMVNPEEFIGVAEQCGLIDRIGEFARSTACSQYLSWERDAIAPMRIAVNVSSAEFRNSEFIPRFASLLNESGVRPYCLEFEITESLFLENSEHVKSKLNWLHERGIHIAIDDFGTGYSSIAYLKRLPFDTLKLDRAFVKDIGNRDGSDELVRAILSMAKSLGKSVIAEGVETTKQRDFLAHNGCDTAQGFLWSEPRPAEEFEAFCREWASPEEGDNVDLESTVSE